MQTQKANHTPSGKTVYWCVTQCRVAELKLSTPPGRAAEDAATGRAHTPVVGLGTVAPTKNDRTPAPKPIVVWLWRPNHCTGGARARTGAEWYKIERRCVTNYQFGSVSWITNNTQPTMKVSCGGASGHRPVGWDLVGTLVCIGVQRIKNIQCLDARNNLSWFLWFVAANTCVTLSLRVLVCFMCRNGLTQSVEGHCRIRACGLPVSYDCLSAPS